MNAHGSLRLTGGNVSGNLRDSLVPIYPLLLNYARRLAGNNADAEDLVHDAIERGLLRGHLFHDGTPERWLATILRHLFLDACRRRQSWKGIHAELGRLLLDQTRAESPESLGNQSDTRGVSLARDTCGFDDVRRALTDLSPALREVFRLFVFERVSQREISRRLSLPLSTVGTRLLRARRRLRRLLEARVTPTCAVRPRPVLTVHESARAA